VTLPEALEITPLSKPPDVSIRVPGSKSITNRALILSALAEPNQGCELRGVLRSEDTEVMVEALQTLGFKLKADWPNALIHLRRPELAYLIPVDQAELCVANSGTAMRFLTAMVSLGHGRYRLDGVARMRERPIEELLSALRELGVNAFSERNNGYPPVIVEAKGLGGGRALIKGDVSSQFLSGLLMAAPLARQNVRISVAGRLVSQPYIAMTIQMMKTFGVEVHTDFATYFSVRAGQRYEERVYDVEPDASTASYFFAAAAITQGEVGVANLFPDSLQGDMRFLNALNEMGCHIHRSKESGMVVRGGPLHGIDIDMNDISDTVMTLAAVACFAEGPTTIRNVAHIRHKETDRLAALATELRRVGAEVEEFADGLTITPRPLHGAEIETYNDHRMAMSMALIGLKVPGIVIKNPGCVAKTYPGFFADLERLR
jgi:3-phosphoshikimate 1-carboxyvinyltransferase